MREPVEIVPFEPRHAQAFHDLNLEWVERYFVVEEPDRRQLTRPLETIIAPGGHILIATLGDRVVGSCALLRVDDDEYELAKMAVASDVRGCGIGRQLLGAAIEWARRRGARRIGLLSHTCLEAAMKLYADHGFETIPFDLASTEYERCDTAMVLRLDREVVP